MLCVGWARGCVSRLAEIENPIPTSGVEAFGGNRANSEGAKATDQLLVRTIDRPGAKRPHGPGTRLR